jgi:hypothetical protein
LKHFFISYNKADQGAAQWIAWQLEEAGYSVVIQAWDFRQSHNFVLDMDRALKETQRVLLVLSPDFLASQYTAPEWAAAFAKDPAGVQGLLLPVRVKPCKPEGLLAQVVYIDLVGIKTEDEMRQRLLAGVDQARRKPIAEPAAPDTGQQPVAPPGGDLVPDPGQRASFAKPPWEASFDVAVAKASGAFWRLLRALAIALVAAVALLQLLKALLPAAAESEDGRQLALIAGLLGLLAMLVVEGGLRWWRWHRRSRAAR